MTQLSPFKRQIRVDVRVVEDGTNSCSAAAVPERNSGPSARFKLKALHFSLLVARIVTRLRYFCAENRERAPFNAANVTHLRDVCDQSSVQLVDGVTV